MTDPRPSISERLRHQVSERAGGRCEYCQCPEAFALERFSIEHVIPRRLNGPTEFANLAFSCQGCNAHKGARIATTKGDF